jgi:hypothetical protein
VTENCPICGADVPFSATVHVLVHTRGEAGVLDYYVCQDCYEGDLQPLFGTEHKSDA